MFEDNEATIQLLWSILNTKELYVIKTNKTEKARLDKFSKMVH